MVCVPLERGPSPLPKLDIVKTGISISGLSSGADFVVQFQVAFSEVVKGLGVFAGQPYHCAVHMFEGDKLVSAFNEDAYVSNVQYFRNIEYLYQENG